MKKVINRLSAFLICALVLTPYVAAQQADYVSVVSKREKVSDEDIIEPIDVEEDDVDEEPQVYEVESVDSLFEETDDTEAIVIVPEETQTSAQEKKGFDFKGSLNSNVGGYVYFDPFDLAPGTTFETLIGFTARPSHYFTIRSSILVDFPKMSMGLYELYINYSLWDHAYIMAGKKEVIWGNARVFDTNILDDESDHVYKPEELLLDKRKDLEKSRFTVLVTVPIWRFNIAGLFFYKHYGAGEPVLQNVSEADLSYAGMVEVNIGNVSFDFFGRKWAKNDPKKFDPAVGMNFNCQLRDLHLYAQYFTHFNAKTKKILFPRMKGTLSAWYVTQEWANIGFILEYQVVHTWPNYNPYEPAPQNDKNLKHYLAFEVLWNRMFDTIFSAGVKCFHDFDLQYGTVIPGIKINDVLPHAGLDIGFPIYYGKVKKYGIAVQLKLNVSF